MVYYRRSQGPGDDSWRYILQVELRADLLGLTVNLSSLKTDGPSAWKRLADLSLHRHTNVGGSTAAAMGLARGRLSPMTRLGPVVFVVLVCYR